ncbi:homoserine O-acetyltransferase [Verticillium alfalfae VaMs.102]|uniref:Homoserine O-acetyltransferase n=1 Tax=Verticillium alfalfae (strain VaMs.102 / ATCC MYA-4576 / FGSC 10136) TaxID=526221 RepID=C9S846_VERA1|nr:homoserine O-acetyltransferase [Verticillium alfalfae VaMs.102]EEY14892.1 homoserine O-acetyltransferase [Verticillium alfalfae VaMs.102]
MAVQTQEAEDRPRFERTQTQPENPFAGLIPEQQIAIIPSFTLESGVTLYNVPVAYTTRGTLNPNGDNAMVICHALTGSADVSDWWGPLLGGPGRSFDTSRFFVVCMNSLGSPYGTASPVTAKDGDPSKGRYGPEFPLTTIRDDVNLHRLLLDELGVKQVAAVIGGSLGGMFVLEWAYFGKDYIRCIVPIATSSRHSAWGISWGEAQRQSIYADPKYEDGYYTFEDPPAAGLGAARMSALLTYRSRNSFESRFGRNTPDPSKRQVIRERPRPTTPSGAHFHIHNDGHRVSRAGMSRHNSGGSQASIGTPATVDAASVLPTRIRSSTAPRREPHAATNCNVDVLLGPVLPALPGRQVPTASSPLPSRRRFAEHIKLGKLERIDSPEGHDAFLLQFEQVNKYVLAFLKEVLPDIMDKESQSVEEEGVGKITKSSTFGEAEVEDITAW